MFLGLFSGFSADEPKNFRISAVQESRVWIEGGLIDGLQEGMDGDICYEITVAGQKKRIVPARVRLQRVEDRQSIGIVREQSGGVNVGYDATLIPKPASDLLVFFNARASESYASKDYILAKQYYQRILDGLPGDPFASQKIKECDARLDELAALARERRNVPYYKEVIRASMESKDPETRRIAHEYIDKILAVIPNDEDALRVKEQLARPGLGPALLTSPPTSVQAAEAKKKPPESKPVRSEWEPGQPKPKSTPGEARDGLSDMVLIPDGDYWIGSFPDRTQFANETPRHQVHLDAFYIDKYEVTNQDYKKFCDATGRSYPGYFVDKDYPQGMGKKPVVMVSWIDADAYARWAEKRLPKEIEWEAAAAGASGKTWPWGDEWIPNEANTRESGEKEPADVGSHPGDASGFGVYDMGGNVSEWTHDWYQPYPGNKHREKEYGELFRVLRGGSVRASKEFARSQFRARLPDGFRSADLGFRCALSAK